MIGEYFLNISLSLSLSLSLSVPLVQTLGLLQNTAHTQADCLIHPPTDTRHITHTESTHNTLGIHPSITLPFGP
jgi:hypothetical protein